MASSWRPNLIGVVPPEAVRAISRLYDAVNEHDRAIKAVNAKTGTTGTVQAAQGAAAPAAASAGGAGSANANALVLGNVNLQSAAYTLEDGDYGGIVVFACAWPVTATLNGALKPMFFSTVENLGPAPLTLMPDAGTVNGAATLGLRAGSSAVVFYDGTNWYAAADAPATIRAAGTVQCGGALSGSFSVDLAVPGATPAMAAVAMLPAGADPNTSRIQGGWLDAGVIAAGTVRVRLVIPPGGTTGYNAVGFAVVVFV